MTKSKSKLPRPDFLAVYSRGQRLFMLIAMLIFSGSWWFLSYIFTFSIQESLTPEVVLLRFVIGPIGLIYSSLAIYRNLCLSFSPNPTLQLSQNSLRYCDWLFDVEIPWSHILDCQKTSYVSGGFGSEYLVIAYGKINEHQLLVIDLDSAKNYFEIQNEIGYRVGSNNKSLVQQYKFGTAYFLRWRLCLHRLKAGKVNAQLHEFYSIESAQQSIDTDIEDSETFLKEFQAIVLEHLKTKVDETTWRKLRNHARTGLTEVPIAGSETWTREQLVEQGVQIGSGSINDFRSGPTNVTMVEIGSIRDRPILYVPALSTYIWALNDETDDSLELWISCPAYPPGW
jgi:hypothetical protein